jgi:hypothetical protein
MSVNMYIERSARLLHPYQADEHRRITHACLCFKHAVQAANMGIEIEEDIADYQTYCCICMKEHGMTDFAIENNGLVS